MDPVQQAVEKKKLPKGCFFSLPSTKRGRVRLAGLVAYTALSIAFPGVPQAANAAMGIILKVFGG